MLRNILLTVFCATAVTFSFGSSTNPDAMRAASAVQLNTKYSSCISLTRDAEGNVISFHVNGINPNDANNLLMRTGLPLSSEYTIVSGVTKEGGSFNYMLPTSVATSAVVEALSKDLVNVGSTNIRVNKVKTGKF